MSSDTAEFERENKPRRRCFFEDPCNLPVFVVFSSTPLDSDCGERGEAASIFRGSFVCPALLPFVCQKVTYSDTVYERISGGV